MATCTACCLFKGWRALDVHCQRKMARVGLVFMSCQVLIPQLHYLCEKGDAILTVALSTPVSSFATCSRMLK